MDSLENYDKDIYKLALWLAAKQAYIEEDITDDEEQWITDRIANWLHGAKDMIDKERVEQDELAAEAEYVEAQKAQAEYWSMQGDH